LLSSARAHGVAIDLPKARRFALRVVAAQAAVTLLAAIFGWVWAGADGARSALLGGGIGAVANLAMALLSFGSRAATDAPHAMRALLFGEAVKLGLVVVLFAGVLKFLKFAPAALFAAYVATFVVYWFALVAALPTFGALSMRRERTDRN
jgi:F0F1-type ATP synthase assembly protein I